MLRYLLRSVLRRQDIKSIQLRSICTTQMFAIPESGDKMSKDLMEVTNILSSQRNILSSQGNILANTLKVLKDFNGNETKTTEQEAAEAVCEHLRENAFNVMDPPVLNHKFFVEGKLTGKMDGLIVLEGKRAAALEVKSRVTVEDLKKFKQVALVFEKISGFKEMMVFVGGHSFEAQARVYALSNNIGVVEMLAHRYRVVSGLDSAETTTASSMKQVMEGRSNSDE